MSRMNFHRDLIDIVNGYFAQKHISYKGGRKAEDLAERYCEMRIRRIDPAPRQVHFSHELNDTLGDLANEADVQERGKALEAWRTVFRLRCLFNSGGDVTPYLSRSIKDATSKDGLLWDYGMHHFHLRSGVESSGFIRRSDYLLFAIVTKNDAFFVDVRGHRDPDNLQWVRQGLLKIVHKNWPEITNARALRGVHGSTLTDEQKKELRRKNVLAVPDLDGVAIAPLGWGTMLDGSSTWCRVWADKLLQEIEWHEGVLNDQSEELRAALADKGVAATGTMDCRLALLDSLDVSPELVEHLQNGDHLSKDIYRMGFAIVEFSSGHPLTITQRSET